MRWSKRVELVCDYEDYELPEGTILIRRTSKLNYNDMVYTKTGVVRYETEEDGNVVDFDSYAHFCDMTESLDEPVFGLEKEIDDLETMGYR